MILISAITNSQEDSLLINEELYNLKNNYPGFIRIEEGRIDILRNTTEPDIELCLRLMLILNQYNLKAKFYISESNQVIDQNQIELDFEQLKVFKMNNKIEKLYTKNRTFRNLDKFVIRSSHETLDSILYSLSMLCFKHEANLEILYDKHFLNLSQIEIATKHQISQVAVSKKLKSNNYEMFKLIVNRI